jgi:hypothetical protein
MRSSIVDRIRVRLSVESHVHRAASEVAALTGVSTSHVLEDLLRRQCEVLEKRLRNLEIDQAQHALSPEEVVSISRRACQRLRPVRASYEDHDREHSYSWSADTFSDDEIEHLVALEAFEKSKKSPVTPI